MPACLCVPCAYTCVASVGHTCDYVEVQLCSELCDVIMYTMSIYKHALLYSLARENDAGGSWGQEIHFLHVNI